MTIKVDLLHSERRSRWRLDPLMLVLFALVLGTNVAFAFYGQRLDASIGARQDEVRQVQAEQRQVEASLPVIEERRARVARLAAQIQTVRDLVHDPVRYANLLTEVAERLPINVWLSSLTIEPGPNTIQLSGTAAEMPGHLPLATVAKLIASLNDSPCFADAGLASTSSGAEGFSFQLTVHYDPQAAVELKP